VGTLIHEMAHVSQYFSATEVAIPKFISAYERKNCYRVMHHAQVIQERHRATEPPNLLKSVYDEHKKQNPVEKGFKKGKHGEGEATRYEREYMEAEYDKAKKAGKENDYISPR